MPSALKVSSCTAVENSDLIIRCRAYTTHIIYNSVMSVFGALCEDLPELNHNTVYVEEILYRKLCDTMLFLL